MTTPTPYDHDLARALGEDARDPAMRRLLGDLGRLYPTVPPSPSRRAAVDRAVYARLAPTTTTGAPAVHRGEHGTHRRVMSLVAAVVLTLGGLAGYLRLHAPTPASAQVILRHAATAMAAPGPDMALHESVVVTYGPHMAMAGGPVPSGSTGHNMIDANTTITADVWTHFDATGIVSQQVTAATGADGTLLWRVLQTGRTTSWLYDARDNTVANMGGVKGVSVAGTFIIGAPYAVDDLRRFVDGAAAGTTPDARLMGQRALGNRTVDVVQVGRDTATHDPSAGAGWFERYYIDAQDYTVLGVDTIGTVRQDDQEVEHSDRVVRREVVPIASVPPSTFALGAPANARTLP